jgi:altronate hydrolase
MWPWPCARSKRATVAWAPQSARMTCAGDPAGHKFALVPAAGAPVHRYGARIGLATVAIAVGDHVHSHNMATALRGEVDYAFARAAPAAPVPVGRADAPVPGPRPRRWQRGHAQRSVDPAHGGVRRAAGRTAGPARRPWRPHAAPPAGSRSMASMRSTILSAARNWAPISRDRGHPGRAGDNPNAGGVLLLGLGCESNQLDALLARIPRARRPACASARAIGKR